MAPLVIWNALISIINPRESYYRLTNPRLLRASPEPGSPIKMPKKTYTGRLYVNTNGDCATSYELGLNMIYQCHHEAW